MFGIYVHVPFCLKRCDYCDFFSTSLASKSVPHAEYARAVVAQLKRDAGKLGLAGRRVDTIFFGGGTPSVMPPSFFEVVLSAIDSSMNIASDAEISSEMNPSSSDGEWLRGVRSAGVGRASIGVQSFDPDLLEVLGRLHSGDDAQRAIGEALESGYKSVSCDLIYGIPGETGKNLEKDLSTAIEAGVDHISAYQLTLEEGTPLAKRYESPEKKGELLSEDEVMEQMDVVVQTLRCEKFNRYEISNYSKPDSECLHNLNYWRYGEYLGLGAGATSFIHGGADIGYRTQTSKSSVSSLRSNVSGLKSKPFALRFTQVRDVDLYLKNIGELAESESIDSCMAMGEFCFMGLRTTAGISVSDFEARFKISFDETYGHKVRQLVDGGLMKWSNDRIRLTPRGVELSDQVFSHFLL